MNPQRAALQLLKDCQSAGLTHLPPPAEVELKESFPERPSEITKQSDNGSATTTPVEMPEAPQDRESQLRGLSEQVAHCVRCQELAETRTQTVFGIGNPDAKVMFIGEAPGADEDRTGEPFVGKAGQLLDKIIVACGWTREELYICNILRCRPPGNRNPTKEEANNCREYLDGQIEIVNPDYIVCWGGVAINNLLGVETPVGRMRGKFHEFGRAKVLCTYHPSYLLRDPSAKKLVWEDLKLLLNEMGLTPKNG